MPGAPVGGLRRGGHFAAGLAHRRGRGRWRRVLPGAGGGGGAVRGRKGKNGCSRASRGDGDNLPADDIRRILAYTGRAGYRAGRGASRQDAPRAKHAKAGEAKETDVKKLVLGLIAAATMFAAVPSHGEALTRDEVKRLALEAILENPDIIMQAVKILRDRDAAAEKKRVSEALSNQRQLLEHDPNAPEIGNPDGDVTVVEFFDYNCPYCKRTAPELARLLASDGKVRVVLREWPILSQGSRFAARAALAARKQGKYAEFHEALMGMRGKVDEASTMKAARELGLDTDRLRADMNAPEVDEHLQTTASLAKALGISGTPSFVIGDALAPGFIDAGQFASMVAAARK